MNSVIKIAIASGKGGTGKTFIATNLFYVLQEQGEKVCLVDCDAEEPNDLVFFTGNMMNTLEVTQKVPVIDETLCTFCGKCHEYCNYKAIFILPPMKVIKVMEDLCHDCGACLYACKYGAISEKDVSLGTVKTYSVTSSSTLIEARMKIGVFSPVSLIKAAVKEAGDEQIVIMDSPPGTSCPFIQTSARADFVVLVTEPTPFGLSDLKQSVETLKTIHKPCGVVINRAGLGDHKVYEYLKENSIPVLLEIPFDRDIAGIYSKGDLVTRYMPEIYDGILLMFNNILKIHGNSNHQR
jgi:MinD superfamily P-loop ATPase